MGTDKTLNAATNVEVITYMEQEILRLGKTNRFDGIFTTNTNPLTQVCLYFTSANISQLIFLCIFSNLQQMYLDIQYFKITKLIIISHQMVPNYLLRLQTIREQYPAGKL